jgi:hypothetical protein
MNERRADMNNMQRVHKPENETSRVVQIGNTTYIVRHFFGEEDINEIIAKLIKHQND